MPVLTHEGAASLSRSGLLQEKKMSRLVGALKYGTLLVFVSFLLSVSGASAEPPAALAERIESLRQSFGVPGFSAAVVEGGATTFARGFGVRDLDDPQPVDAKTNFAIGSITKGFTAAALARLVDEGRIWWNDPVIDHLPDFRMQDPWVTREMTIRDLLVHRSGLGLGAGDLLFVPRSDLSRAETVRRLRHIEPETSFRNTYAYNNLMYVAAGLLMEAVTEQTWEDYVHTEILMPAGMIGATVNEAARAAHGNIANPHARLDGSVRGMGEQTPLGEDAVIPPNAAPAGGITASANDMARWMTVQLARGRLDEDEWLFSAQRSREMWTPVTIKPVSEVPEPLKALQPNFDTYALGWTVRDYRGARLLIHGGGVFGGLAMLALLPEEDVGIFLAMNSEEAGMLIGLTYELLDHYLGLASEDWPEKYRSYFNDRRKAALSKLEEAAAKPAEVGPSLSLERYTGAYRDPWFGTIEIRVLDGRLMVEFPHWPGLTATLEHWQYDTFRTAFSDPSVEPAFVTFGLDARGSVSRITMEAVSPIADFSYDYRDLLFTPVAQEGEGQ